MLLGLMLTYILLFILFILATLLPKLNVDKELTRKLVHIGISNWYFIALAFFTDIYSAIIPPISFIFLNYLSFRYNLVEGIERRDKKDLGTIYYPISILILVIFAYGLIKKPYIGAIGAIILGYGDGIASIVGRKLGKIKIYRHKSVEGSLTMFIISFLTTYILLTYFNPFNTILYSLIIAFIATLLELFSPRGIDNLTVPIFSSLIYYLLIL